MAKIVINFPIVVECDVKSHTQSDETLFNIEHMDVVELTNIKAPCKINLPASAISVIE